MLLDGCLDFITAIEMYYNKGQSQGNTRRSADEMWK
jgi:hypothetical protein